jgi:hypothetical protein
MSLSYKYVLGLEDGYTLEQLNQAYWNKISTISNSQLSDIDKQIYAETLKKYYTQAKNELHRRQLFNFFDEDIITSELRIPKLFSTRNIDTTNINSLSNVHSSSSTYKEKLMPDGSRIIINESTSNNNGDITKNTNSYRRLPNGETEPIEYNEALTQIQNKLYLA